LRDLLTGLAILLLLLLTGAAVGPHFIDWEERRGAISETLSAALGQEVVVEGPIDISLLPTPSLKLGHIRLGGNGAVRGHIGRFRGELGIPSLIRGEIRILEARLQGANLIVSPRQPAAGQPPPGLPLSSVGFDRLSVEGGRVVLLRPDGAEVVALERVDGQLEATSLLGPVRGSLAFELAGERRTLRFSTGKAEAGALRLRALLENETAATRTDFDGSVRLVDGLLTGDGALAASGNVAVPLERGTGHVIWRLAAKVKSDGARAALDDIQLALGNTDRQTMFTGSGDVDFGRSGPVAKAVLSTRQLDLDRLLTGEDPRLVQTPEATVRNLVDLVAAGQGGRPWLSGDLEVSAGSLLFGGEALLAPKLRLSAAGGAVVLSHVSAELPGRSMASFEGVARPDSPLAGRLDLDARDLAKLTSWYQGVAQRQHPIRRLRLAGDLRHGPGLTEIANASLVADEMRLNGAIRLSTAGARPKLSLALAADQLDIAKLPDLPESDQPGAWDLDLAVDAKGVRYAGVGAGAIALRLRKDGESTLLDELTVRGLDGADLTAKGTLGGVSPRLDLRLRATRMEAMLQLADRLTAHWGIPVLASRSASLAPADLTLSWRPEGESERRLTASGRLGETEIELSARLTPTGQLAGARSLDLRARGNAPAGLLRQIGIDAIPVLAAGPFDLRLAGGWASARTPTVDWSLNGLFGGVQVALEARQTTSMAEPVTGQLRLTARDVAPLAQTLLIAVPAVTPGQDLALQAKFDLRGYRITLRDLDLASGGQRLRGEIAFNLAEFGRVSGQIRAERLNVDAIAPLIAGATRSDPPATGWDTRPFQPGALPTLPGDLWIEAGQATLGDVTIQRPRFVLRFDNGLVFVEHAEAEWLGGRLTGQATLRRIEAAVSLSTRLTLEGGQLARLPFAPQQALAGTANVQLDASALGESPAALVAALAGTGRVELRDAAVAGLQPALLDGLIRSQPTEFAAVTRDALTAALERRMQGRLPLPAGPHPLSLAAGVLRVGPIRAAAGGEASVEAAVDFRSATVTARALLSARDMPKGWTGPAAAAEIVLRGPWASPVRTIDVGPLANGLTAIAIQREQERIEILEQDQRERSFFNRRLRAAEEQRRAEEEERKRQEAARKAAEEARLRAEEEERRRVEEERRRQEEERRRAEAERRAQEAARLRAEEEERRRVEAERRAQEAARLRAEEEERRRVEEERRRAEAERRALEAARLRAEEEERRRVEAERRAQEAQRRAEEEAARRQALQQRIEEILRAAPPESAPAAAPQPAGAAPQPAAP
jgi:uncharacterized protein involved in outer membrane biogenesis